MTRNETIIAEAVQSVQAAASRPFQETGWVKSVNSGQLHITLSVPDRRDTQHLLDLWFEGRGKVAGFRLDANDYRRFEVVSLKVKTVPLWFDALLAASAM